jgi:nucleoside phosphorylase
VVVTGVGQVAAATAAAAYAPRAAAVVVCGLAGGLGGPAGPGDVLVASRLLDAAGADAGPVHPVEVVGAIRAAVASVDGLVDDVAGRAALRDLGAAAVETEAAAWSLACAQAGIPLTVVRAILDTPAVRLGPTADLVRPGATGPRLRDLSALLVRPAAWPALLRVGRLAGPAERRAAEAAVRAATALAVPR